MCCSHALDFKRVNKNFEHYINMQLFLTLFVLSTESRNSIRGPDSNCESEEESTLCQTDCEDEQIECLKECMSDTACTSDCTRQFSNCIEVCPCLGILLFI